MSLKFGKALTKKFVVVAMFAAVTRVHFSESDERPKLKHTAERACNEGEAHSYVAIDLKRREH